MSDRDVFSLDQYRQARRQACQKADAAAVQRFGEIVDWLEDLATEAAFSGPWKEWADAEPVGASVEVTREALEATGHPVVLGLLALADHGDEIRRSLTKKKNRR